MVICIFICGVAGFFILPRVVKTQAEKRLTPELGRAVTIGRVRNNPFALSLTVEDFDIQEKAGAGSFFGWGRPCVRFDEIRSLVGVVFGGGARAQEVRGHLVSTGHFSADRLLLVEAPAATGQNPGPRERLSFQ